jgi:hypothetical protein
LERIDGDFNEIKASKKYRDLSCEIGEITKPASAATKFLSEPQIFSILPTS